MTKDQMLWHNKIRLLTYHPGSTKSHKRQRRDSYNSCLQKDCSGKGNRNSQCSETETTKSQRKTLFNLSVKDLILRNFSKEVIFTDPTKLLAKQIEKL